MVTREEVYKMKRMLAMTVILSLFIIEIGCITRNKETKNMQNKFSETNTIISEASTIKFVDLEGGFYAIISNDGMRYDPINLPDEFKVEGLRVSFEGKLRNDMHSFHMWGKLVEIIKIKKLD